MAAHLLKGAAGQYKITGATAKFVRFAWAPLNCAAGQYKIAGNTAAFKLVAGRLLKCAVGSYKASGVAATFHKGWTVPCAAGAFTFSGRAAALSDPPMTIAIDGHAQGTAATSTTVSATLTTANTGDVIVALVLAGNNTNGGSGTPGPNFPGMQLTDSGSHLSGWQLQYALPISNGNTIQIWWTTASVALSSDVITATFKDSQTRLAMIVFGVSGANTTSPFDSNSSIFPGSIKYGSGTANTGTNAFSTSSTHSMVVNLTGTDDGGSTFSGTAGYTLIENTGSAGDAHSNMIASQSVVSAAQSNITPSNQTSLASHWVMFAFAIAAAGETASTAIPPIPVFEGGASASKTTSASAISVSMTTNQGNDVLVAAVTRNSNVNVSSITSTNTTGWTKYSTLSQGTDDFVDIWYGAASGVLTNESISANFASAVAKSAIAIIGLVGANSNPFDPHAGLPATNSGSGFTSGAHTGSATSTDAPVTALIAWGTAGGTNAPLVNPSATQNVPFPLALTNSGGTEALLYASYEKNGLSATTYTYGTINAGDYANMTTALDPGTPAPITETWSAGSYSVTGSAAATLHGYVVQGAAGSYSITGSADKFVYDRVVSGAAGSYSITGSAAATLHNYFGREAAGSYSITGDAAAFLYDHVLSGATGAYSITGDAALMAIMVPLAAGSYAIAGDAAATLFGRTVQGAAGSFAVSGDGASLLYDRMIADAAGSYSVSGDAAATLRGRTLQSAVGSFAVSGDAAAILYDREFLINAGSYTITGAPSVGGTALALAIGSYAIAGDAAGLLAARLLRSAVGSYALSGDASAGLAVHMLRLAPGSYTLNGDDAGSVRTKVLALAPGVYAVAGDAAILARHYIFTGLAAGVYTLTGRNARIVLNLGITYPAARTGTYPAKAAAGTYPGTHQGPYPPRGAGTYPKTGTGTFPKSR